MPDEMPIPDLEAIYAHLRKTLAENFDIPAGDIRPDARLYEDLDIDSLDVLDLITALGDFTGIKVKPERFQHVSTVEDVADVVQATLAETSREQPA